MVNAPDMYMGFVGVSTSQSSIMKVFPRWAKALELPTQTLFGHDVPIGSSPEVYRQLVQSIRTDKRHLGCLVTTHKIAVYDAANDLFDGLDSAATTFGEISSIAKRGARLTGAAKDPSAVRLALDEFLPLDHFRRSGADALVIGSGGSGCALSHQLGVRADHPTRIICVERSEERLEHQRQLHAKSRLKSALFSYVKVRRPEEVDALVADLSPCSLVVNATGMGKDVPGSPTTDAVPFPRKGVIWDFNYRGSLEFLHQANARQSEQCLQVEDGWRYFIHGWTQVISDVFDIPMPADRVDTLSQIASEVR